MIHLVVGHICAGKSTWVRERAGPRDVVIDFDRIAESLAAEGTPHHDYTPEVVEIARGVRWGAIEAAVRLHARGLIPDLWIVHAYPSDDDIARYRRLGAGIKTVTAPAAVLLARADAERPERMRKELRRRLAAEDHPSADPVSLGSMDEGGGGPGSCLGSR